MPDAGCQPGDGPANAGIGGELDTAARPAEAVLRTRVHVGCGPRALKRAWWNVDLRAFQGVDEVRDVSAPWIGYAAVEYVYGEHFIEHLRLDQAVRFLSNAHGAMRKNGRIRLSTPSLEWVLSTHFDVSDCDRARMLTNTYRINRAFHGWGHRFLWSRPMLEEALSAVGFADVRFYGYGESDDPSLRGLEEHGGYSVSNGLPSVWIAEAAKRSGAPERGDEFLAVAVREFQRFVDGGH